MKPSPHTSMSDQPLFSRNFYSIWPWDVSSASFGGLPKVSFVLNETSVFLPIFQPSSLFPAEVALCRCAWLSFKEEPSSSLLYANFGASLAHLGDQNTLASPLSLVSLICSPSPWWFLLLKLLSSIIAWVLPYLLSPNPHPTVAFVFF